MPTRPPALATALSTALVFAAVALGGSVAAAHRPQNAIFPRMPSMWVSAPASTDEPARAAVDEFVPMLSGDDRFTALVGRALREQIGLDRLGRATGTTLASIRRDVAARGLPDVVVGIPYVESRLWASATSPQCAAGPWQLLPEVAVSEGLRVEDCTVAGVDGMWSPGRLLPDPGSRVYLGAAGCGIVSCAVDDRRDLARSTRAALALLTEDWNDPTVAGDKMRVPLTVMAYNGGLGGVQHLIATTDDEPMDVLPDCATGDCLVLARETANYLPRVVAAAAIVACNGATNGDPDLSDWATSDLCRTLGDAGFAPPPSTSADALAFAARKNGHGHAWVVGLATLDSEDATVYAQARELDGALARSLGDVPGVHLIAGVPGEAVGELFDEGADVVITGQVGRIGSSGRSWLRLLRQRRAGAVETGAFAVLDPNDPPTEDRATGLLSDALLRPSREHRADAIAALVQTHTSAISPCLVAHGGSGPVAHVSVWVDALGRPSAVSARGDSGVDEPTLVECLEGAFAGLAFPRELAGAGTMLDLGLATSTVAEIPGEVPVDEP